MKRLLLTLLLALSLPACANQTAQITTGQTLSAMHDFVKVGATAADQLCKQGVIAPAPCMDIKAAYGKIRASYPLASDAVVLYLKSGSTDAKTTFLNANALFVRDYQELTNLLIQFDVIKEVK